VPIIFNFEDEFKIVFMILNDVRAEVQGCQKSILLQKVIANEGGRSTHGASSF